jgi:hypothetical protein
MSVLGVFVDVEDAVDFMFDAFVGGRWRLLLGGVDHGAPDFDLGVFLFHDDGGGDFFETSLPFDFHDLLFEFLVFLV